MLELDTLNKIAKKIKKHLRLEYVNSHEELESLIE